MKIKLSFSLLILITSMGFAQNSMQLMAGIKKLYTANYEMDFETIVSLSYPGMVDNIGKDKLLAELDHCFQNEDYRYRYQLEMVPFITHQTLKIGTQTFCIINCRNPVRYFFEKKLNDEEAVVKRSWLQEFTASKEVLFEPKRNSFTIRRTTTFLAIMDETTGGEWKFINLDDPIQAAAAQTLFNENTKKQLGLSK